MQTPPLFPELFQEDDEDEIAEFDDVLEAAELESPDSPESPIIHEPMPTGNGTVILDLVIQDLKDKAEFGKIKYGTYLRTYNGRNALKDAYQEALDLAMYLRQKIEEERIKEEATI